MNLKKNCKEKVEDDVELDEKKLMSVKKSTI